MKTVLILTEEHPKPMPDLTDLIAGRAWSIQGVEMAEARLATDVLSEIANSMIPLEPMQAKILQDNIWYLTVDALNVIKLDIANG